ncbi:DNA primase subunit pri2 [Coemansia sp. RSA 552]|nr:DNA primase subunit pri2 [Coemansia sp. RSA 552]
MFSQKSGRTAAGEVVRHTRYPERLTLYTAPPTLEVSVEEFEAFALDRLQVLRAVEDAQLRTGGGDDDARRRVGDALARHLPLHANRARVPARQLASERRKDHVSHFILRLAFSRTEELRTWFVRQESALLRHRFRDADAAERRALLEAARLPLRAVAPDAVPGGDAFYGARDALFEVDFEHVPDLVARAQVAVHGGRAFVAQADVAALVANAFRARLARDLTVCARALPQLGEDARLVPVLHSLSSQSAAHTPARVGSGEAVSADDVDALAPAFPLCMQALHGRLREAHHLRHGGRMQLGLFLKGIGLGLPDALIYWRRAFAVDDARFQKTYAYNIRHNYGAEGRRADYAPYSCHRIITSNPPGPADHHGCPFRHAAPAALRARLARDVPDGDARDIAALAGQGHCQVACTRHLEARLRQRGADPPPDPVASPNHFFDLCRPREPQPVRSPAAAVADLR